jgi:hypothetical protein
MDQPENEKQKRTQSEIISRCWETKQATLQDIKHVTTMRNCLIEEVVELKAKRDLLVKANTALTEELDEVKKGM